MDRHHRRTVSKGQDEGLLVPRRNHPGGPGRDRPAPPLTVLSSFRPLHECDKTAARTLFAFRSWLKAFDSIHYFGSESKELRDPKVRFIPSEQFPRILSIVQHAATLKGWTAIVNADIVIRGDLRRTIDNVARGRGLCAVSRRYEFTTPDMRGAAVVDLGLDFFIATQSVWHDIAKEYPDRYRFGHSSWDALMLGAFNCVAKDRCWDITKTRSVYHPRHGERRQVFHIDDTARTRFRDAVFMPRQTRY